MGSPRRVCAVAYWEVYRAARPVLNTHVDRVCHRVAGMIASLNAHGIAAVRRSMVSQLAEGELVATMNVSLTVAEHSSKSLFHGSVVLNCSTVCEFARLNHPAGMLLNSWWFFQVHAAVPRAQARQRTLYTPTFDAPG